MNVPQGPGERPAVSTSPRHGGARPERTGFFARASVRWTMALLAPIGFATALATLPARQPLARLGLEFDRAGAVSRAREHLAARGVDTKGLSPLVGIGADAEVLHALGVAPTPVQAELRGAAPPIHVRIVFHAKGAGKAAEAKLSAAGEVFWWEWTPKTLEAGPGGSPPTEVAERAFQSRFGEEGRLAFGPPTSSSRSLGKVAVQDVTRRKELGAWSVEYVSSAAAGRVLAEKVRLVPPPGAAPPTSPAWVGTTTIVLVLALALWGLVRFGQRLSQREVSMGRAAALFLVILVCGVAFSATSDRPALQQLDQNGVVVGPVVAALFGIGLMGLWTAVAWAGGEGDMRERFPGSLTSFDALVSGRLLSRNVARSAVFGSILSGILALSTSGLELAFALNGRQKAALVELGDSVVSRAPAVSLLSQLVSGSLVVLTVLLLLFLPLAARLLGSRRAALAAFVSAFVLFQWAATTLQLRGAGTQELASILLMAAFLVIAFASGDLLSALVVLPVASLLEMAGILAYQPDPSVRAAGVGVLLAVGGVFAAATVVARRGRELSAEEVRPRYARDLVEKESLKAELALAGSVRARLLPPSLPAAEGVSLAALSVPAAEVGGDAYDAFLLPGGGLAFTVAEGGGKGASSALVTTLAKGLLTSYARRGLEPAAALSRVRDHVTAELGPAEEASLVYGTWSPESRTLVVARLGSSAPAVWWREEGAGWRELQRPNGDDVATDSLRPARHGSLVVLTDGWEVVPDVLGLPLGPRRLRQALSSAGGRGDDLLASLRHGVELRAGRLRPGGVPDDVTAVVLSTSPGGRP